MTDRFGRSLVQLDAGGTVQGLLTEAWHKPQEDGEVDCSGLSVCLIHAVYMNDIVRSSLCRSGLCT